MRALSLCALVAACGAAPPLPASPALHAEPIANTAPPVPVPASPSIDDTLVHGHPTVQQFDALVASFPSLSAARRATIAALGTSDQAPIRVPDIADEYVWVAKIACNGTAGQVQMQALVEQPAEMDRLDFSCPGDTAKHAAYFDFSSDPAEQAMLKELGVSP